MQRGVRPGRTGSKRSKLSAAPRKLPSSGVSHPIGDEDRERYANLLAQMKARIDWAMHTLQQSTDVFAVESAARQLRKVIELVALGSLITNRQAVKEVTAALERKGWNGASKTPTLRQPEVLATPEGPASPGRRWSHRVGRGDRAIPH